MARFAQLGLALLALAAAFGAHAESVAPTYGAWAPWSPTSSYCSDAAAAVGNGWTFYDVFITNSPTSPDQTAKCRAQCTNSSLCGGMYLVIGVTGGTTTAARTGSCPADHPAFNPTSRLCDLSTEQQACAVLTGMDVWVSTVGRASPGSTSCSEAGCNVTLSSTVLYVKDKTTGVETTEAAAKYDGSACTYNPAIGPVTDTCPGGTSGEINGVVTCVPYDPNLNVLQSIKTTSSSVTTTVSTPSGTTTTSKTEGETKDTTCAGDKCTTKTTRTSTGSDGTSTTSTTTTTQPKADHCKENPQDPSCGEESNGAFEGNCNAGFKCKGDAALCAAARAVNEQKCLMTPGTGIQAQADKITDGTWAANLPEAVIDVGQLDQSNPFGGSCPPDQTFQALGASFTIPLAAACPELQMLGNFLVAMTLLTATIFVLRGFGST
jgi:hypothetical protein